MKKCCLCNENIEVVRSLCGEVAWTEGHNADPLAEGRCCDTCNWTKVVPALDLFWKEEGNDKDRT